MKHPFSLLVPRVARRPGAVEPAARARPSRRVGGLVLGISGLLAVLGALLAPAPLRAGAQLPAPEDFAGHWEGILQIPGVDLAIMVDLKLEGGRWSGTIDIPMQGARGMALARIQVDPPELRFVIADAPSEALFTGILAEGKITGTLRQGGSTAPFSLSRDQVAGPPRPQEPKPPFPYRTEDVVYRNGEITLAGTLTIPPGRGPFPAALLASGSGQQDRDGAAFGHKPLLVLADALTRAGIVVLRVDDRGAGGSSGSTRDATTEDLAGDALAGVKFLRDRPEVDRKKIGIIGHSEGALVGALAASRSKDVRYLVLLASTGRPGSEVIVGQMEAMSLRRNMPPRLVDVQNELLRIAVERVAAGADTSAVRAAIGENGVRLREAAPESLRNAVVLVQSTVVQLARGLRSTWFRHFLDYDPRPALRRTKVPVLALHGELDLQVVPDQHLPEIEKALAEGGNKDVTARRLPGLNHLFQPATTGLPDEYMKTPITIDPAVLDQIREWILQRFGRR